MRRTKAEAEQTRQDILHAALQLFDEQGYGATSLVQIAKQVGLTRGAIYWHFKDKGDILRALGEYYLQPHIQKMAEALHHENSWQESCEILIALFGDFHDPQRLRLVHLCHSQDGIAAENSDIKQMMQHYGNIWEKQLRELIERACRNGEIHPDTDPTWALIQLASTLAGLIVLFVKPLVLSRSQVSHYAPNILRQTFANIAAGQCREPRR